MAPPFLMDFIISVSKTMLVHDVETWRSKWPQKKREQEIREYDQAVMSVRQQKINERMGFGKDEFYLGKALFSWRMIQACHPIFNRIVSPWIAALHKLMAKHFDDLHPNMYFASNYDPFKIGDWVSRRRDTFLYECDFSKFDSSIQYSGIDYMIELFRKAGMPDEVYEVGSNTC